MAKRRRSTTAERKLEVQNKRAYHDAIERAKNGDEKPQRSFTLVRHGKPRSEYNQLRQDLKAASRPNVKRKPSLPKLPWDDKEETK